MKISLTGKEFKELVMVELKNRYGSVGEVMCFTIVHVYSDGSGESEADSIASFDRIDIHFYEDKVNNGTNTQQTSNS